MPKTIDEKLLSGREYRKFVANFEVRVKKDQDADQGSFVVEGYATRFNEPYELYNWGDYIVLEQVDAHAFDECDMDDVIFQYDHVGRVFARTSNDTLTLDVDANGLHIVADLGGTETGRQLYEEIKGGYTNKMSFGFVVSDDTREYYDEIKDGLTITTCTRTINKISKLYDVSAVSIPANDATEISARSLGDGVVEEIKAERSKALEIQRKKKTLQLKLKMMED